MGRKKSAARITSHNEMLERISFEIGRAILSHLEAPATANTSTAAIDRGIDYLKLNGFDAEALAKAQRNREALKRLATVNNGEGGATLPSLDPLPLDYDDTPLDPEYKAALMERVNAMPDLGDPYAARAKIPDRSNR